MSRWLILLALWSGFADAAVRQLAGSKPVEGQPKKVALVIGNGTYQDAPPLKNPVNDAKSMAFTLQELGFDVTEVTEATQKEMNRAIGQFGKKLTPETVALFYYAGHGLQAKGKNYIVPVDAQIDGEAMVYSETVEMDTVLAQLNASSLSIVILDACRNNPFERRFRASGGGLVQMEAPKGSFIAFATSPGRTAADGEGANGLYTSELLKQLRIPNLSIEAVFKRVRANVARITGDTQVPWENTSLTGDFFFRLDNSKDQEEGRRLEAIKEETRKLEALKEDARKQESLREESRRLEAQKEDSRRQEALKEEVKRLEVLREESKKLEARRQEALHEESMRQQAQKDEAKRLDAMKTETEKEPPPQKLAMLAPETHGSGEKKKFGNLLVGNKWKYSYDSKTRSKKGTFSYEITDSNPTQGSELISVQITGEKFEDERNLNQSVAILSTVNPINRVVYPEFSPYLASVKDFELRKSWSGAEMVKELPNDSDIGTYDWNFGAKIVGKEIVKVPAGQFETIKIEFKGNRPSGPGHCHFCFLAAFKETIWYAPEVKRYVKRIRSTWGGLDIKGDDENFELLDYNLK